MQGANKFLGHLRTVLKQPDVSLVKGACRSIKAQVSVLPPTLPCSLSLARLAFVIHC